MAKTPPISEDNNTPIFGKKPTPTSPVSDDTSATPIFGKKITTKAANTTVTSDTPIFGKKPTTSDTPIFGKKSTTPQAAGTSSSSTSATSTNNNPSSAPTASNGSTPTTGSTSVVNPSNATITPAQPMNPKTKKKLILGIVLGLVAIIAVAVTIIIIVIVNQVDYKTAYAKADEVKDALSSIQSDSSCYYVTGYVQSSYYSEREYSKYLEKCRTVGEEIGALVTELGDTDAVKKNSSISEKYAKFKEAFDKTYLASDVNDKLELYQAYHNFVLAEDDLDYYGGNTEAELEKVADYLINSGNSTLKQYGETWLKLRKAVEAAYKAYYDADWSAENHSELYDAYSDAYDAYADFIYDEEIDWEDIAEIDIDLSDAQSTFRKLYKSIENAADGKDA